MLHPRYEWEQVLVSHCNGIAESAQSPQGHMGEFKVLSYLMKQKFGDAGRYFVQSCRVDSDTLPFKCEIKPPWFNQLYVPQIQTFGELYVFFINQTVISIVHQQPKTTDFHLVLAVTPLDLLL